MKELTVRWTIGDVSARGYEALGLSILGLTRLLPDARAVVTVNSVPVDEARRRLGEAAELVDWMASDGQAPDWLRPYLHSNFAQGVAWKFAPVRLSPDRFELSLDNDVVLWELPAAIKAWMADGDSCLIAEDVVCAYGQFVALCGDEPRNSGIRGLPPGFRLDRELRAVLERLPVLLSAELDEQGLQVAVVTGCKHHVVSLADVSICSPFPPHSRMLGRCGAHFVGLNAKTLPWRFQGKSGEEYLYANWDGWQPEIRSRIQAAAAANASLVYATSNPLRS
jgi:hypothetical protein